MPLQIKVMNGKYSSVIHAQENAEIHLTDPGPEITILKLLKDMIITTNN